MNLSSETATETAGIGPSCKVQKLTLVSIQHHHLHQQQSFEQKSGTNFSNKQMFVHANWSFWRPSWTSVMNYLTTSTHKLHIDLCSLPDVHDKVENAEK